MSCDTWVPTGPDQGTGATETEAMVEEEAGEDSLTLLVTGSATQTFNFFALRFVLGLLVRCLFSIVCSFLMR